MTMNKATDMTDSIDHLFDCIRISDEGDYHPGKFTIEAFGYWNQSEPSWGMPAWDERGWPEFMEHFDSWTAAVRVVADSGWDLKRVV